MRGLEASTTRASGRCGSFWCYVIVGLMAWCYHRGYFVRATTRVLMAGSFCWIAAWWWSAESAIFATVIWLPSAIALMLLQRVPLTTICRRIAIAIGALVVSGVFIELAYVAHFGHGPDWRSFFEYGMLYGDGSAISPLTTLGVCMAARGCLCCARCAHDLLLARKIVGGLAAPNSGSCGRMGYDELLRSSVI